MLKYIEQNGEFDPNILDETFNNAKSICVAHNKIGDPDSEMLWFSFLDKLIESYKLFILDNYDYHKAVESPEETPKKWAYQQIANIYSRYVSSFFEDMTKHVAVESLLAKLQDYKSIRLGELKNSLVRMLETYYYESSILEDAKCLSISDNSMTIDELFDYAKKPIRVYTENFLEKKKVIVFECGHAFSRHFVYGNCCIYCTDPELLRIMGILSDLKKAIKYGKGPRVQPNKDDARSMLLDDVKRFKRLTQIIENRQKNEKEKSERGEKPEKPEKNDKAEKLDKSTKLEKNDKTKNDKNTKLDKKDQEKPEKIEITEIIEKDDDKEEEKKDDESDLIDLKSNDTKKSKYLRRLQDFDEQRNFKYHDFDDFQEDAPIYFDENDDDEDLNDEGNN